MITKLGKLGTTGEHQEKCHGKRKKKSKAESKIYLYYSLQSLHVVIVLYLGKTIQFYFLFYFLKLLNLLIVEI